MKFTPSGRRNSFGVKRSNPKTSPGSLFGEKIISCVRCCNEFPNSQLRKVPPSSSSYIYVCLNCMTIEEKIKDE